MQPSREIGDANMLYYIMNEFNYLFSEEYDVSNIIEVLT